MIVSKNDFYINYYLLIVKLLTTNYVRFSYKKFHIVSFTYFKMSWGFGIETSVLFIGNICVFTKNQKLW